MPRKQFTSEQIITKLREAEVLINQGMTVGEAARQLEISEQTYYRWRKEYGGLDTDDRNTGLHQNCTRHEEGKATQSLIDSGCFLALLGDGNQIIHALVAKKVCAEKLW